MTAWDLQKAWQMLAQSARSSSLTLEELESWCVAIHKAYNKAADRMEKEFFEDQMKFMLHFFGLYVAWMEIKHRLK